MYLPDNTNDAPPDRRSPIYIKQFAHSLLVLLLSHSLEHIVEYAIAKDDWKDKYIAIVASLVDSNDEAVPLDEQW